MDLGNQICCEDGFANSNPSCIYYGVDGQSEPEGKNISVTDGYPNPTKDNITFNYTLQSKSDLKVRIFSSVGTQMGGAIIAESSAGKNNVEISTKSLTPGEYLIVFQENAESIIRRFTVIR